MNGQTKNVTFADFETVVDTHEIVILDFWSAGCGPCQVFAPFFEAAASAFPNIFFGKVDTETSPDLAEAFQIRSVPTLMAFKKSELVFEHAGLLRPDQFEMMLHTIIALSPPTP